MKKTIFTLSITCVIAVTFFACQTQECFAKHTSKKTTPVAEVPAKAQKPVVYTEVATRDYLMGKFNPKTDTRFAAMAKYALPGMYLRTEANDAFVRMSDAAKRDGIQLIAVSTTRNFADQKVIWENKWNGKRLVNGKYLTPKPKDPTAQALLILSYSSMPGTSRHHWGTEVDINSVDPNYFETKKGKQVYDWLVANAATYGFCQTYTPFNETRTTGYSAEAWHWSYTPLSRDFTRQYIETITNQDITGFTGSQTAPTIDMVQNYISAINPACL